MPFHRKIIDTRAITIVVMIGRNHDNNMAQQCLAINKLLTLCTQTCSNVYFMRGYDFFFCKYFIIICAFPLILLPYETV